MPDTLEELPSYDDCSARFAHGLRALEREVEREWRWLNGALHAVAQIHAERSNGSLAAFREMQVQARDVDRRRVEITVRIAALAGRDAD